MDKKEKTFTMLFQVELDPESRVFRTRKCVDGEKFSEWKKADILFLENSEEPEKSFGVAMVAAKKKSRLVKP